MVPKSDSLNEVQIDQRGNDSLTNTEGHLLKVTGAICNLQATSASTAVQIGTWHNYVIEANGARIRVTLNGQSVNDYQSTRQQSGYIALHAHDFLSRLPLATTTMHSVTYLLPLVR